MRKTSAILIIIRWSDGLPARSGAELSCKLLPKASHRSERSEVALCKVGGFQPGRSGRESEFDTLGGMISRRVLLAVAVALAIVRLVSADDNVRAVQTKLREGGFYSGEIDGAYSSELAAALTRYQIRNGLPITGQL